MLIKHRIIHRLSLMQAKSRVRRCMCPMCNSDAPELYDCPVCDWYKGPFPPSKGLRAKWLISTNEAINAKLSTMKLVYKYKKIRGDAAK